MPSKRNPIIQYVDYIPDLMEMDDYKDPSDIKKIRISIRQSKDGLEILGDSMYPALVGRLFHAIEAEQIEEVLCG